MINMCILMYLYTIIYSETCLNKPWINKNPVKIFANFNLCILDKYCGLKCVHFSQAKWKKERKKFLHLLKRKCD